MARTKTIHSEKDDEIPSHGMWQVPESAPGAFVTGKSINDSNTVSEEFLSSLPKLRPQEILSLFPSRETHDKSTTTSTSRVATTHHNSTKCDAPSVSTNKTTSENSNKVNPVIPSSWEKEAIEKGNHPHRAVQIHGMNTHSTSITWDNDEEPSALVNKDQSTVVEAHLAPDEEEMAAMLADRLHQQMTEEWQARLKQEVEAQLSSQRQNQVIAEAVVTTSVMMGDGTMEHLDDTDKGTFKICGNSLRMRWILALVIVVTLLIIGMVTGVVLHFKNKDKDEEPSISSTTNLTTPTDQTTTANEGLKKLRQELEPWIIRTEADRLPFEDPSSPQSLALKWLSSDSVSLIANNSTNVKLERYILALLYFSTDGPNWTEQKFKFLTESNACSWNSGLDDEGYTICGVYCDGPSNVTDIFLENVGLSGTLPWELSLLSDLLALSMDKNALRGTIPIEFSKLSNLKTLYVASNFLTGTLPVDLSSSMERLDLSMNSFTGTLPSEWGDNMSQLIWFSLLSNKLTGTLPVSWQGLYSLHSLDLGSNQITGTIPVVFGTSWLNIVWMYMEENELNGPLPSEFGQLTALEQFFIYDNDLTGTVPTELAQLVNLTDFQFEKNQLTGSVDDTLCASRQWKVLESDCLPDNDGKVEIVCNCCTGCCNSDGDVCKGTLDGR